MSYKYSTLSQHESGADYSSVFTYSGDENKMPGHNFSYSNAKKSSADIAPPKQTYIDYCLSSLVIVFAHLLFLLTLPVSGFFSFKVAHQYERFLVYRLGRLRPVKGPGVVLILPCIDRWEKVDLRTKAFNVPPSKLRTTDGCVVSIGAIIQFRINDPLQMTLSVQDVDHALRDSAMSDMTNLLSKKSFHDIKSKRQNLAYDLQIDMNHSCKEWGVEVARVELSDVTLLLAPKTDKPPVFMPMYGVPPPPEASDAQMFSGGDALGGLAQLARQFLTPNRPQVPATLNHTVAPFSVNNLLTKVKAMLSPDLVNEVGVSYEFEVDADGKYYLDLKSMPAGDIGEGCLPLGSPDVVISLSLETLQNLFAGIISTTYAYATGKLNVKGDTSDVKKLEKVFDRMQIVA